MKTLWYFSTLTLTLFVTAACSSSPTPPPTNPNAGRYSINQDRAPTRIVDINSVPEVIPVPLTRGRAGNRSPYSVLGKSYTVLPTEEGYSASGVASWYGEKFHGHKTSNGEIFDMYLASAAHKSLPIPSFLRVTNLANNRSIVVRVNDRGPFHGNRLIDLSYAAATQLGYAAEGTARVQLDAIVVRGDENRTFSGASESNNLAPLVIAGAGKYLQVGAFSNRSAAEKLTTRLRELTNAPVFIRSVETLNNGQMHRVRIGPLVEDGELDSVSRRVVAANLGNPYTVTE